MASDLTETEAAVDTTSSAPQQGRRRRSARSSDRRTVLLMAGIPSVLHVGLVWLPAAATILLSFTNWNGFALDGIDWVGFKNYQQLFTVFEKDLYEALLNNLWVVLLLFIIATPLGMFLAYLMDKNLRGHGGLPERLLLPGGPLAGRRRLHLEVGHLLAPPGPAQHGVGPNRRGQPDRLARRPGLRHRASPTTTGSPRTSSRMMVPMIWRHAGYIMVLYLAGLKSVDPALKEAAAIDGCSEWQTFRRVTFPSLKPVNVVIVVITVIEALRIFDIIDVLNNPIGTDVLSILVTESILGESSNIGRGSAYGVILLLLCLVFVVWYLRNTFREEEA